MVVRIKNMRWEKLVKENIPLAKLAQHFEACTRSKGKSSRTVEYCSRVLMYFRAYLKEHDLPEALGDIDIDVVNESETSPRGLV